MSHVRILSFFYKFIKRHTIVSMFKLDNLRQPSAKLAVLVDITRIVWCTNFDINCYSKLRLPYCIKKEVTPLLHLLPHFSGELRTDGKNSVDNVLSH